MGAAAGRAVQVRVEGRRSLRGWFRDLRVSRKLMVVIVVHLLHASVLLVVTAYGMKALSASRAYVEGEGLWGKAEKESVVQLTAYIRTGDPEQYKAFLREINVTLGDKRARLELDKPNPDMAVVEAGFVAGKLSPLDVPNLAWLYRNFGWERHISEAVGIWRIADENITQLLAAGEELHLALGNPVRDEAKIDEIINRIYEIDGRLTVLEDDFSRVLGNGARWLTDVATWGAVGLTVLFVGGALAISSVAARQITSSLSRLKGAAQEVAAGDLASRAGLTGRDEVAEVGRAFDGMADRVASLMEESKVRTQALRESFERFQALAEESPLGIFHTDAKGRVDYANQRWVEIAGCGYSDPDAIRAAIHPDDVQRLTEQWRESLVHGKDLIAEFRYRHKDGVVVECASKATALHDVEGHLAGYVGYVEDVTQRRQVEQARKRDEEQAGQIARLEELNAFRTRFINTAAHELRTPLTPLRAQMHLLVKLRSANYTDKERHSLEIVDRNIARLGVLVEDLLEVARYEAGRLAIDAKEADLDKVLTEAAESYAQAASERGIKFIVTPSGDAAGVFDANRISQVIYNLLGNAVKFTPPGGTITAECLSEAQWLQLRITDTGIGVRPEAMRLLFQPFSQVHDSQVVTQPGSGLGLYICKAIVDLHGGDIVAASGGLGHGLTVNVTLPRRVHATPAIALRADADP